MMQHQEQETRETLPRPRFIHEELLHLGTLTRVLQAAGHAPDDVLRTTLAKIDGLEREWRTKLDASLNALADAVNDKDGWVGELTTDQWQQITDGLRAIYRPHMGQVPTPDELVEELKAHLEQQNGGSPL